MTQKEYDERSSTTKGTTMKDQHKHIKGYRDLTQVEVDLINRIKEKGEEVRILCDTLKTVPDIDPRWLAIGITNLQQGFMAVIRSVAKPDSF